ATLPVGINASNTIAGFYENSDHVAHAFVRDTDGTIKTFDAHKQSSTVPASINSKGTIVGTYYDIATGAAHAFVRGLSGKLSRFDPFGAAGSSASSINDRGAVTGWYLDG